MATYVLYSPPTWDNVVIIEPPSLRVKIPTSTTTYKLGGQWFNIQSPGMGATDGATYVFNRPTLIDSTVAAEMQAAGVPGTYV